MSKVVIIKDESGRLRGLDEAGQRAYTKFKKMVLNLPIGQTLSFTYRMPRSLGHHRLFFAKLQSLLARTEAFSDLNHIRHWLTMGAGYADFVPGLDGKPNAIPQSLDFDSMDEATFSELHHNIDTFLWTTRAQETLWPQLDAEGRYRCVESLLNEFQ